MSKIVEFRIGKGRTLRPGEAEEWTRKYLELTIKLPEKYTEEGFHEAVLRAEQIIDEWLAAPEVGGPIPEIDPQSLDALPWKARDGSQAKPGSWGWLHGPASFTGPEQGTSDLIQALDAANGKLVIGDYEYTYAKDKAFIQRRPISKKK